MTRITKEQAAEILSMTTRAVERYTKQNRLSATYERGRTRPVPMYDEAEVKALAASLLHPAQPAIMNNDRSDNNDRDVAINPNQALQRAGSEQGIAMLVSMLSEAANAPHATCMLLSVKEAASFSGLSSSRIMKAIHDKELDGRKIGRGFKVRPADVREYVRQVFDEAERYRKADKAEQGKIGARTMKA
jgi:excisionase family DNA binding protein